MDGLDLDSRASPNPAPRARTRAFVLYNDKARSVGEGDGARLVHMVRQFGFESIETLDCEELSPQALHAARPEDVLIVLGGDGTARTAAKVAMRGGPTLILLPGGTLNVLPRALYGERAWPEALEAALERGVVKQLVGGAVNGKPFFTAAMFGAPTLLARAREAVREGKFMRAVKRAQPFFRHAFARSLRARPGHEPMKRAEAVGILCPSFSGRQEGALEWARFDAAGMGDLIRLGVKALSADWRNDPSIDLKTCARGDIISLGAIPATLDGEPRTFHTRVKITTLARGPRVLMLPPEGF